MDDLVDAAPSRRRRSDARRSVEAIVGAACTVLGERADASVEEIAAVAGVTRQTVYAHFPSRDALVGAVLDTAGRQVLAAVEAAQLDARPPSEALSEFLDIGWQFLRRYYSLLLDSPAVHRQLVQNNPHHTVTTQVEQIIRHGRRTGRIRPRLTSHLVGRRHSRPGAHRRRTGRQRATHTSQSGGHAPGERPAALRSYGRPPLRRASLEDVIAAVDGDDVAGVVAAGRAGEVGRHP